jgi:spore germination cell wall hydrolase CwlJ-like protein
LFPSTVRGVILDTRSGTQFPPAHRNPIDSVTPSAGSLDAARRVLNGETASGIGNSLYFNRTGASSWAANNRPFIITIGNHDFFG